MRIAAIDIPRLLTPALLYVRGVATYQYNVVNIAARGGGDKSDDLNRDGRQGDKSEGSDRGDESKVLEEGMEYT